MGIQCQYFLLLSAVSLNQRYSFVSANVAASAKLAYVDPGSNRAIIKVDNTSNVPFNEKRNTVRISTKDRYALGSVWVADMFHLPYGVGNRLCYVVTG